MSIEEIPDDVPALEEADDMPALETAPETGAPAVTPAAGLSRHEKKLRKALEKVNMERVVRGGCCAVYAVLRLTECTNGAAAVRIAFVCALRLRFNRHSPPCDYRRCNTPDAAPNSPNGALRGHRTPSR